LQSDRHFYYGLASVQAGVCWAAFAIAESGSLVEFTTDDAVRLVSALPRVHGGVFRATDLVGTLAEAASRIRNFYAKNPRNATVSFISGPSRTGDIEMQLILGVHGLAETHAVVITSNHVFDQSKPRSRRFKNSPSGLRQFKALIFHFAKIDGQKRFNDRSKGFGQQPLKI
jgi:hypothetical protein